MPSSMRSRIAVLPQYLLPKLTLTRFIGWLASRHGRGATHAAIRWFIRRYGVNMDEAADSRVESYSTFNEFFTRALRADARLLADAQWLCPVDGAVSRFGTLKHDQIFQAKGHDYDSRTLLGGDAALAAQFDDGLFATLYLGPKDYHRIHMPCRGRLRRMIHVPGNLFSVNPTTALGVPNLFARNERVVCVFDTDHGPFVLALVGATIVGSMATVWHGVVNPPRPGQVREWDYSDRNLVLERGAEMGHFLLGSTVVMLFPKNTLQFNSAWTPGGAIRMGQAMASLQIP